MVSEVFLTTLSVSGFGFLLAVLGVCYKSKCKTIDCGCIKIVRDVEGEEKIDIDELTLRIPRGDAPLRSVATRKDQPVLP